MTQAFAHEDLEIKQYFLQLAREYHQNTDDSVDKELAAALLYMNVADYLAEYLVTGMAQMAKEAMSKYYLGIVSVAAPQRDSFNIGNAIHHLQNYDFPKKTGILAELTAINKARKKISHQILKTQSHKLPEIDEAVTLLVAHTEALVLLVDEITPGLPPTNLLDKMNEVVEESGVLEDTKIPKAKPTPKSKKK